MAGTDSDLVLSVDLGTGGPKVGFVTVRSEALWWEHTATRGHLTRAVLEGVALNAAWLLGAAERFVGTRLDDIRLLGGGARSDLWCQVLADATDRTIVRVTDPWLAGLRGAALFAALSIGRVDRSELRGLVPTDDPFRPDPRHRATYDVLAGELPKLYAAQRGFFRRHASWGQRTRPGDSRPGSTAT